MQDKHWMKYMVIFSRPQTLTHLGVTLRVAKIKLWLKHTSFKNDIRDVESTADLVFVFMVHLVHWYLVHCTMGKL